MSSRTMLVFGLVFVSVSKVFAQGWVSTYPVANPVTTPTWTNGNSVVYRVPANLPVGGQPRTVWRETFNGVSARPVTYQTVAYGSPACANTHQVYYTSAGTGTCASPVTVGYTPTSSYTPYPTYANYSPSVAHCGYGVGTTGNYYVGYGIFGQPRAYAQNQPVLNFFRSILP